MLSVPDTIPAASPVAVTPDAADILGSPADLVPASPNTDAPGPPNGDAEPIRSWVGSSPAEQGGIPVWVIASGAVACMVLLVGIVIGVILLRRRTQRYAGAAVAGKHMVRVRIYVVQCEVVFMECQHHQQPLMGNLVVFSLCSTRVLHPTNGNCSM